MKNMYLQIDFFYWSSFEVKQEIQVLKKTQTLLLRRSLWLCQERENAPQGIESCEVCSPMCMLS